MSVRTKPASHVWTCDATGCSETVTSDSNSDLPEDWYRFDGNMLAWHTGQDIPPAKSSKHAHNAACARKVIDQIASHAKTVAGVAVKKTKKKTTTA